MTSESSHCALCHRRDGHLLEVNSTVPFVCDGCAKRVGRHILGRAGHGVIWQLDAKWHLPNSAAMSALIADELKDLTAAKMVADLPRVSLAVFEGPVYREPPEEALSYARLSVDFDVREALKSAAKVLVDQHATDEHRASALRIVFRERILRNGGVDRLRRLLFKE